MSSLHDFATWEPLLRLLRAGNADRLSAPDGRVGGQIGRYAWRVPLRRSPPPPGQAARFEDMQDEFAVVKRVQSALAEAGEDSAAFVAELSPAGKAVLHLLRSGPAVEPGIGSPHPGALVLVEDAVPEPWRRMPEPVPGAVPAPSADPAVLERTLRERVPGTIGATEAEMAAAEARLGVALPDAAVQGLVGSPGWIVFGDNGGGDRIAVDLTPGPRGHTGQIIILGHEQNTGADLLADSLTDLVLNGPADELPGRRADQPPVVAHVNIRSLAWRPPPTPGWRCCPSGCGTARRSVSPRCSGCPACGPSPPVPARSPTRCRSRS